MEIDTTAHFEVHPAWMKACGKGEQAKVFKVLEVTKTSAPNPFFAHFVTLDDNGRGWVVMVGRGRFV